MTSDLCSHFTLQLWDEFIAKGKSYPVVSTRMSRGHFELPVRILTTWECTRNGLTLFGNATVHCRRVIFYEKQFIRHLVWMLHVGAVICCDLAQTCAGLRGCRWQIWCFPRKCECPKAGFLRSCLPFNHFTLRSPILMSTWKPTDDIPPTCFTPPIILNIIIYQKPLYVGSHTQKQIEWSVVRLPMQYMHYYTYYTVWIRFEGLRNWR